MANRLLMISGFSGCGKTYFCRWLACQKHFVLIDMDTPRPNGIDDHGFRDSWEAFIAKTDRDSFVRELQALGRDVVLDWNYPVDSIDHVLALKERGCEMWWFTGDEEAAHRSYLARGYNVSETDYQKQVAGIRSKWREIAPIVGDRIISTIDAFGVYLTPECTWRQFNRKSALSL
jgi:hypothetical protein